MKSQGVSTVSAQPSQFLERGHSPGGVFRSNKMLNLQNISKTRFFSFTRVMLSIEVAAEVNQSRNRQVPDSRAAKQWQVMVSLCLFSSEAQALPYPNLVLQMQFNLQTRGGQFSLPHSLTTNQIPFIAILASRLE